MTGEQKDRELRTYLAADTHADPWGMDELSEDEWGSLHDALARRVAQTLDAPAGPPLHEPTDRDADNVPSEDRTRGFSMWFDRERWGVIIDGLIQHRGHADARKAANSESTSDVRADMCADLIGQLNAAASDLGADNVRSNRLSTYAEALLAAYDETFCEGMDRKPGPAEEAGAKIYARAVMAVADREQAALRAEAQEQMRAVCAHADETRARAVEAEATIARVEEVAERWESAVTWEGKPARVERGFAARLRIALDGPEPTEETQ